jgi:hypothetical protein
MRKEIVKTTEKNTDEDRIQKNIDLFRWVDEILAKKKEGAIK